MMKGQAARLESVQVPVEGIDEDPEWQVGLQLGSAPGEHDLRARVGALAELCQQPRLADAGLPDQLERPRPAALELGKGMIKYVELLGACAYGGHMIWWSVEAGSEAEALGLLPFFVAQRATATRVGQIDIP